MDGVGQDREWPNTFVVEVLSDRLRVVLCSVRFLTVCLYCTWGSFYRISFFVFIFSQKNRELSYTSCYIRCGELSSLRIPSSA